jgi:hypothetical protein
MHLHVLTTILYRKVHHNRELAPRSSYLVCAHNAFLLRGNELLELAFFESAMDYLLVTKSSISLSD